MALTWSIENVENYMELVDDENEANITESLVWKCASTGLSKITAENAAEFYTRCKLLDDLDGPIPGYKVTPEMVHRRIGMVTNWSYGKPETWAHFVGRILKSNHEAGLHNYERSIQKTIENQAV